MSGTVVKYNDAIFDSYKNVLRELKKVVLEWAYDATEPKNLIIPQDILAISERLPTINGKETIYRAVKLWKTMFHNPNVPLPLPTLKRIIPATHAEWNMITKGGSDTITKLVDDCVLNPPRCHTNYESAGTARCISNLLAFTFKLYHIVSSQQDLSSYYPGLRHWRNANASCAGFKTFLRMIYVNIEQMVNGRAQMCQQIEQNNSR